MSQNLNEINQKYFYVDKIVIKAHGEELFPQFTRDDERITLYIPDILQFEKEDKQNVNVESFLKYALDKGKQDETDLKKFTINENLTIIFREPTKDEKEIQNIEAITKYETRRLHLLTNGYKKVSFPKFEERWKKNLSYGLVEQIVSNEQYETVKANEFTELEFLEQNIPEVCFTNQFLKVGSSCGSLEQICKVVKQNDKPYLKNLFVGKTEQERNKSIQKDFFNLNFDTLEQYLAFNEILLNPNVDLAFITGMAGSGKSQLSLAAIIYQIMCAKIGSDEEGFPIYSQPKYDKFLLLSDRKLDELHDVEMDPNNTVKYGLKHYEQERKSLFPQIKKYVDLIDKVGFSKTSFQNFLVRNQDFENTEYNLCLPSTSVRRKNLSFEIQNPYSIMGATILNSLIYLDEAHKFGKGKIREIIGKVGLNSKLIISGDIDQIADSEDNIFQSEANGFLWAIDKFIKSGSDSVGLMKLIQTMRSKTARMAYK